MTGFESSPAAVVRRRTSLPSSRALQRSPAEAKAMRSALKAGCARSRVSVVLGWAARGRAVARQTSAHTAPDEREWNPMAGLLDEDVAGWLWEVLRVESITALPPRAARRRSGGFLTEPRHQP